MRGSIAGFHDGTELPDDYDPEAIQENNHPALRAAINTLKSISRSLDEAVANRAPANIRVLHGYCSDEEFNPETALLEIKDAIYRETLCGPGMGVEVEMPDGKTIILYDDDLDDLSADGVCHRRDFEGTDDFPVHIVAIHISSIVEGIEATTDDLDLDLTQDIDPVELCEEFQRMLDATNEQATELWMETHGCPRCKAGEGDMGYDRVNPECKGCGGKGVPI